MLAAIRTAAVLGVDAYDVTVEVDVAQGLPQWTMVGTEPLAETVRECRAGSESWGQGVTPHVCAPGRPA